MQVSEFTKPISSNMLNENMAKTFGYKLNLESFNLSQLEDARNRLRTQMSVIENSESYDNMLESNTYHKTRTLLDVINQAIKERSELGESVEEKKEKMKKDPKKLAKRAKAMESISDEWRRVAAWRIRSKQDSARDLIDELVVRAELEEDQAQYVVARLLAEMSGNQEAQRILTEGEEERAELIMASKDMVDRLTGWLEDTASMQAENMLELLDSIRDEMGSDVSEKFGAIVKPALAEIYTTLEKNRQALSGAVGILTGQEPEAGMGMEMGPPETPEAEAPEEAPPMPGGDAGREQRESVDLSRRLGMILSSKKVNEATDDILDIIGSLEAIQRQADAQGQPAVYNWAENTFSDFTGLTLEGLKRLWDSPHGKTLKQYIKRFDDSVVEIKTKKDTSTHGSASQNKVSQMAKSATSRRQG